MKKCIHCQYHVRKIRRYAGQPKILVHDRDSRRLCDNWGTSRVAATFAEAKTRFGR